MKKFSELNESRHGNQLVNDIYDKLMDNENEFNLGKVENQELDLETNIVTFTYQGKKVKIKIEIEG